jgi:hypothetical protein
MTPVNAGRCDGGAEKAIIVYEPLAIPAPPIPAMARPTINVVELLATAQMREPISKMKMLVKNEIFSGKYLYLLIPSN